MNLQAGLSAPSSVWESLLTQEGLSSRSVDLRTGEGLDACSVLIVVRTLDAQERDTVEQFLRGGGALLAAARHVVGVAGTTARREPLRYLVSEDDAVFSRVRLLDLGLMGDVPREANRVRTDQHTFAIAAGPMLNGHAVLLPFDIQAAMTDIRAVSKAFYARRERLPSERVSLIARGELFELVHTSLEYLHHVRGLPYAHLWYYPGTWRNVLAFRIDTDGSPKGEIDAMFAVLRDTGVPGTWFLDVGAHESWLQHFSFLEHQEMSLHCYRHRIEKDPERQAASWARARDMMTSAGMPPKGFAAPFGAWTPALGQLIDGLGFSYSSEFSWAYDSLPLYPRTNDGPYRTLQVPVHPISVGSLRRVGAGREAISEYFLDCVSDHLERNIPLFFYHHPLDRQWSVVAGVLQRALTQGVKAMTLGAYAAWWKGREALSFQGLLNGGTLRCAAVDMCNAADVGIRISVSGNREVVTPVAPVLDLQALVWHERTVSAPPPDLRRIREVDPRRLLGDLYTAMVRRLK